MINISEIVWLGNYFQILDSLSDMILRKGRVSNWLKNSPECRGGGGHLLFSCPPVAAFTHSLACVNEVTVNWGSFTAMKWHLLKSWFFFVCKSHSALDSALGAGCWLAFHPLPRSGGWRHPSHPCGMRHQNLGLPQRSSSRLPGCKQPARPSQGTWGRLVFPFLSKSEGCWEFAPSS